MLEDEIKYMKDEIKSLKDCQTKYVSLSVTVVGVILSLFMTTYYTIPHNYSNISYNYTNASYMQNNFNGYDVNIAWLIPLLILLPFSHIFFDKAKTIQRMIGYSQILEGFNRNRYPRNKFIGWESSMAKYRSLQEKEEKIIKQKKYKIVCWEELEPINKTKFLLSTFGFPDASKSQIKPSYYMGLVYMTFFLITVLCLVLAICPAIKNISYNCRMEMLRINMLNFIIVLAFLLLSISVLKYDLKTLYQLQYGFHTIEANATLWEVLLLEKETYEKISQNPPDISLIKIAKTISKYLIFSIGILFFVYICFILTKH